MMVVYKKWILKSLKKLKQKPKHFAAQTHKKTNILHFDYRINKYLHDDLSIFKFCVCV